MTGASADGDAVADAPWLELGIDGGGEAETDGDGLADDRRKARKFES